MRCSLLVLLSIWLNSCLFTSPCFAADAGSVAKQPLSKPLSTTKGLLIVAPQRFEALLLSYVRHKQKQLPTRIESLERILKDTTGVDDPERLKRFLFHQWKESNIGYVLLVGDADILPVRYMVLDRVTAAAFDYAFYPSDLYYSDIARADGSFDDWNARKEDFHSGYFGEVRGEKNKKDPINFDQIDYRPDIAVGRWPVSTADEVRLIAEKTMRYENGLPNRDDAQRAAFIGVGGWVDTRPLLDRLAASLPVGWSAEKRYYADAERNDKTLPPDTTQVHSLLNQGVGLLYHTGHGTDTEWEQCFSLNGLDNLRNADRLPILFSAGCSTARFATLPPYEAYVDREGKTHKGTNAGEVFTNPPPPPAPYQKGSFNPPGLGEQLLRGGPNGAVAYIGCNTGSQPCGLTLMEGFVKAFQALGATRGEPKTGPNRGPRLGDCWSQAVSYYYDSERLSQLAPNEDWYPASIFFQGMKFMLFGDPTLLMPTRPMATSK
jgi:hypothetical protein